MCTDCAQDVGEDSCDEEDDDKEEDDEDEIE